MIMSNEKVCSGCGAVIQTIDEDLPGYVPSNVLLSKDKIFCQRCFRLRNYNENKSVIIDNDEYMNILEIPGNNNLILYVIDLFNFHGSLISEIKKYKENNKIIVVINKIDIFPKSVKINRVLSKIRLQLDKYNIPYDSIEIISTKNNFHFDDLIAKIKKTDSSKNIYIIGNANVGKSSIVNSLLKYYKNDTNTFVTTSVYPGTTLKTLKIPFSDNAFLYDTPGLFNSENIYHYIDNKNLKYILPQKEIKPQVFQLNNKQSLFLGSIARIDFIDGNSTSFIVYCNNQVKLHRTKLDEKTNEKFNKFILDKVFIPKSKIINSMGDLQKTEIYIPEFKRTSLVISGLAFIDIMKGNVKLNVYAPNGTGVSIQESFIGEE